ncbi:MAG TPA: cytochrome d ubiquinol oxidase subunit II [Candidatus Avamphibacillus intestinigallinarum]|nr:cytochrome d ubiquinol oxidase subunit II [Candidatus Avamphibacillus intestinigallinarum]
MMSLPEFWFLTITFLFVGFFVLEGFDFGVGMVARFLGKDDKEVQLYMNTIGPFWDANEVWLIVAGGAMFAAFPHWYATMFSGFYIPLVFMLLALIIRGVSFEFRGHVNSQRWRNQWDWGLAIGSFLPPLLWGVVLANFMTGMPIDQDKEMVGGFLQFLHPFALLGGVMMVALFLIHGLQFITIRTLGEVNERAKQLRNKLAPITLILFIAFIIMSYFVSDVFTYHGETFIVLPLLAFVALAWSVSKKALIGERMRFTLTSISIILLTGSIFMGMFPRVMISSISDAYSLTVENASSGSYSLKLMMYFSLAILPFVLAYQIWSFYIFKKRLKKDDKLEY